MGEKCHETIMVEYQTFAGLLFVGLFVPNFPDMVV